MCSVLIRFAPISVTHVDVSDWSNHLLYDRLWRRHVGQFSRRHRLIRDAWQELVDQLHHVEFDAGLTDAEVADIECTFAFRFPPDLSAFLQTALPRGPKFPDWRSGDEAALRDWLGIPRQGIPSRIRAGGSRAVANGSEIDPVLGC